MRTLPRAAFQNFLLLSLACAFCQSCEGPPVHQLLGWSQGQITPSQHQAVTWSRRVGRGGREPGRRISPAPLPPRILWSRLPIFRRNPKHNSPPSSQTATGSVPDRSSLPRVCLEAGLSSAEMAPSAASKNETKGRGSGWEDDSLKIFSSPFFLAFCFLSFPPSFSSFIPAWARWMDG